MIPALVQWEITDLCNLRCQHCYHIDHDRQQCPKTELPAAEMLAIAEILVSKRLFFVTFTGGEPLIKRGLLLELAKYLHQAGIILSVNTNLLLLDENYLGDLKIHRLLISCPAVNPAMYFQITGGNFTAFESKLRMVIAAGVDFTVNMVVSKLNFAEVKAVAVYLAKLGVKNFATTPASLNASHPNFNLLLSQSEVRQVIEDLVWVNENLGLGVDIMEAIPKCAIPPRAFELQLPFVHRFCRAGQRNGTIASNGDVRPCSHNPEVFGNVLKEDIGLIWDRMRSWRRETGNVCHDCLSCDTYSHCGGGCRVDLKALYGQSEGKHPYMAEGNESPRILPKTVQLKPDMMVKPCRTFLWRPEKNGWLVASGSSRNIIEVNDQLCKFLIICRDQPSMTLSAIAQKFGAIFEDVEYQRIMAMLIQKKYFVLTR